MPRPSCSVILLMLNALAPYVGAQTPAARDLQAILDRISQEADAFRKVAPHVLSEETLAQRSRPGLAALIENDRPVTKLPAAPLRHSELVSEYGYAGQRNAPAALHEIRKVIQVDGHEISTVEQARHAMTLGLVSSDDKQKKRLLEDFEKHGLKGAVTDFGQIILLFSKRRMRDYDFHIVRETRVGVEPVLVLAYKQVGGPESLTIFRGTTAVRQPLEGEIWVRASDGMPLRVTLLSIQQMKNNTIRDEAAVDYSPTPFGAILPVGVLHREFLNAELLSENIFRYAPFRRFSGTGEAEPARQVAAQAIATPPIPKPAGAKPSQPKPADNVPIVKAPVIRLPQQ